LSSAGGRAGCSRSWNGRSSASSPWSMPSTSPWRRRKRDFVRNPWRILDLAIIVIPFLLASPVPAAAPLVAGTAAPPPVPRVPLRRALRRPGGAAAGEPRAHRRRRRHAGIGLREGESRPRTTTWEQFLEGVPGPRRVVSRRAPEQGADPGGGAGVPACPSASWR
jgi:hypothetical protein